MVSKFKVGDLVSYNYSPAWRGGKGRVTSIMDTKVMVQSIDIPYGAKTSYPNGDHSSWYEDDLHPFIGPAEAVEHPAHYGGGANPYEVIKVIEAWELDFHLGNTVKYIARAGKKDAAKELEDLKKGRFYIDRRIENLEEVASTK